MPHNAPPDPIPAPARPQRNRLPHALTFFLTAAQRRAVLEALRPLHPSREHALLHALRIHAAPPPPTA